LDNDPLLPLPVPGIEGFHDNPAAKIKPWQVLQKRPTIYIVMKN
jgi:hypothetical protein